MYIICVAPLVRSVAIVLSVRLSVRLNATLIICGHIGYVISSEALKANILVKYHLVLHWLSIDYNTDDLV